MRALLANKLNMLLPLVILVADHSSARALQPAVKRMLARDLLVAVESVRMIPNVHVSAPKDLSRHLLDHHQQALALRMQEQLRSRDDIMHDYLNVWQDPAATKVTELATAVYSVVKDTADTHVEKHSQNNHYSPSWHWGAHTGDALNTLGDTDRARLLEQRITAIMQVRNATGAHQDSGVDVLQIYRQLATKLSGEALLIMEDIAMALVNFPQLNFKVPPELAEQMYIYMDSDGVNLTEFSAAFNKHLLTTLVAQDNTIPLRIKSKTINILSLNDDPTPQPWISFSVGNIMHNGMWYYPALELAQLMFDKGVTEKQLREHVFTPTIFAKLLANETITEPELAAWQQSLSREELTSLLTQLGVAAPSAQALVDATASLLTVLQLEGFTRATAAGMDSNAKFITQLRDMVAADSMYAPLAREILTDANAFKPQRGKRKRRKHNKSQTSALSTLRQELQAVEAKMFVARKNYLSTSRDYLLYSFVVNGDATLFKIGQANFRDYVADGKNADVELLVAQELVGMVATRQAEQIEIVTLMQRDGMSASALLAVMLEFYGARGSNELRAATAAELDGIAAAGPEGWLKLLTGPRSGTQLTQLILPALEEADARINVHKHIPRTEVPRRDQPVMQEKNTAPEQPAPAEQKLARRVTKLAARIGRAELPPDIPMWLRLRALINYADTTAAELVGRATMHNIDSARLTDLLSPESEALPTYAELQTLRTTLLALHTPKKKKRRQEGRFVRRARNESLQNIEKEINAQLRLVGKP